jgi:hypothetical protein
MNSFLNGDATILNALRAKTSINIQFFLLMRCEELYAMIYSSLFYDDNNNLVWLAALKFAYFKRLIC